MELKNYFAQDAEGNAQPNAACYLYNADTTNLANGLVDAENQPLTNPFVSDGYGLIQFKVPNGLYDLRVISGFRDYKIRVQAADASELIGGIADAVAAAGVATDAANLAQTKSDIAFIAANSATDARDAAQAYAIDVLTSVTEVDQDRIAAQQAALDAGNAADAKVAILRNDLANTTDPLKGAGVIGWKRSVLDHGIANVHSMLDAQSVNIWEFSSLIINKPTPSDITTWDWTPAMQAALDYMAINGGELVISNTINVKANTLNISGSFWSLVSKNNSKITTTSDKLFQVTGDLIGVKFKNITLTSTGTTGTVWGLFTSNEKNILGLDFESVEFTAPASITNGCKLIAETTATIKNVNFTKCNFHHIGAMGIEFQNHSSDQVYRYSDINIVETRFNQLGENSVYGMAVSLSGKGERITVNSNTVTGAKNIGIECVGGVRDAFFMDNTIKDLKAGCSPFSFTNSLNTDQFKNIQLARNTTVSDGRINLYFLKDSLVSGNSFTFTGSSAYLQVQDAVNNIFPDNNIVGEGIYCVFMTHIVGGASADNTFTGSKFSNKLAASNNSCIGFDGIGTTRNMVHDNDIVKGTGGSHFNETNGADLNRFFGNSFDSLETLLAYQTVTMGDANYTLTSVNSIADTLRFNGTLTANRTITVKPKNKKYTIYNATNFSLDISTGSTSITILPGYIGNVSIDSSNIRNISSKISAPPKTITGTVGNAVVSSLLTELHNLGLIINSTTP